MKVTALIRKSSKKNDADAKATIYFRIRDDGKDFRVASELTIYPKYWSQDRQGYKDRVVLVDALEQRALNDDVKELCDIIRDEYRENSDKEWLAQVIDKFHHPYKYEDKAEEQKEGEGGEGEGGEGEEKEEVTKPHTFFELFDEFLEKHHLSDVRRKNFCVIERTLMRYELFVKKSNGRKRNFALDINMVDEKTLADIWNFMENEHTYAVKYPKIFEAIPERRTPLPRGKNTLIDRFCRIRTFFLWCYSQGKTVNRPFDKFHLEECVYGTPIYITLEERNKLFEAKLDDYPQLAVQRDIFVFQSVVGCRVGDLYNLTKTNIVDGALEYIQKKTSNSNPRTIRVPLNNVAMTILERYKDYTGDALLPLISEQKYNQAIKRAFKLAGLDRMVTIINPLTRQPEQKRLYEIVSTHTARKTFIGNMYKKVKDPDLVSSVSGHKEGSKAFRRYREIDEDMKKELVHLLD